MLYKLTWMTPLVSWQRGELIKRGAVKARMLGADDLEDLLPVREGSNVKAAASCARRGASRGGSVWVVSV